jgi:outer membrane protein assembly factor BamB
MRRAALLAATAAVVCPAPAAAADWKTFGFDSARTGFNPVEHVLSPSTAASLRHEWSYEVGGVLNAQPLYAEDAAGGRDVVYVGSERGRFAALDAGTGAELWTRRVTAVDTICNDVPEGVHGISATPVLDRRRRTVWVAGGDGRVWAFDLATGRGKRGWPIRVGRRGEHIWGALALRRERLYVATASHCNNAFYRGRVAALDPDTGKRRGQWQALGRRAYGGGVWGWGGAAVGPDGDVFVATANAQGTRGNRPYAEHVVRLSERLRFEQANDPGPPRRDDNDFTGAPILFRARGCPSQLAVMHKTGQLFLYDRARIRRGPRQRIQAGSLDAFLGLGTYAWSQPTRTLYLANGSSGRHVQGMVALRLGERCRLRRSWQQPVGTDPTWPTAPVVANGVVLFGDGSQKTLHAFDARDGTPLWDSGDVTGDLYGAPIVAGGRVFAPSWDEKLHAFSAG